MVSDDKTVYIMGDFNIDLLKCETSKISQDFLLSLQIKAAISFQQSTNPHVFIEPLLR